MNKKTSFFATALLTSMMLLIPQAMHALEDHNDDEEISSAEYPTGSFKPSQEAIDKAKAKDKNKTHNKPHTTQPVKIPPSKSMLHKTTKNPPAHKTTTDTPSNVKLTVEENAVFESDISPND